MLDYLSFVKSNAFRLGVIISAVTILHTFLSVIVLKLYKVRIQKIGVFFSIKKALLTHKVKSTVIELGWIPTGSFAQMALEGLSDEKLEDYHLYSKSKGKQIAISMFPLVPLWIFILFYYSVFNTNEVYHFYDSYIEVLMFDMGIEDFRVESKGLFQDDYFTVFSVCVCLCLLGLSQVSEKITGSSLVSFVVMILVLFITLPFYRLALNSFSISNMFSYLFGMYIVGVPAYLLIKYIYSKLPQY